VQRAKRNTVRALAAALLLLAAGMMTLAMTNGGDVAYIALGFALAASSMEMFRQAQRW
jgi:hypothetical protein